MANMRFVTPTCGAASPIPFLAVIVAISCHPNSSNLGPNSLSSILSQILDSTGSSQYLIVRISTLLLRERFDRHRPVRVPCTLVALAAQIMILVPLAHDDYGAVGPETHPRELCGSLVTVGAESALLSELHLVPAVL